MAQALGIDIDSVDLDGATADSYELWLARNRANAELDVPTSPAAPASAANLGPAGRDTNVGYHAASSSLDEGQDASISVRLCAGGLGAGTGAGPQEQGYAASGRKGL